MLADEHNSLLQREVRMKFGCLTAAQESVETEGLASDRQRGPACFQLQI